VPHDAVPTHGPHDASTYQAEGCVKDAAGIARVRHRVVEQLVAWGCADTDGVALVLSELVTNAVVHAGGAVDITVTNDGQRIRIAVRDNGSGWPRVREGGSGGGLGLHIVTKISERWGSEATNTGKIVWATVRCPAD
jgi:anti-sigma regulatory factor (Ser/Thr protein kinase)